MLVRERFYMKLDKLIRDYENKLKAISNEDNFVYGLTKSFMSMDEIIHMMTYIDKNPGICKSDIWLEKNNWIKKYKSKRSIDAIIGFVVGDALGVPVEFTDRDILKKKPVKDMRAFGTHNQPVGTWSDDSSMVIATMDWYVNSTESKKTLDELDYRDLMDKFLSWMMYGDYTPYGDTFDIGIATSRALKNYGKGLEPLLCGGKSEFDNGNGSLMRILPVALFYRDDLLSERKGEESVFEISALTHAHPRSKLGCLIYSCILADMMKNEFLTKEQILNHAIERLNNYIILDAPDDIREQKKYYNRIFDTSNFKNLKEKEIKSSGYVVDTLEAAIWCFVNTNSYKECVLKAVNLGDDTDTVGAVAGGLAGLYYGEEKIPKEWIEVIPRYEMIRNLAEHLLDYR